MLIVDDQKKRSAWKLVILEELFTGQDGGKRVARVRIGGHRFLRPVQRLVPMELSAPSSLCSLIRIQNQLLANNQRKLPIRRSLRKQSRHACTRPVSHGVVPEKPAETVQTRRTRTRAVRLPARYR